MRLLIILVTLIAAGNVIGGLSESNKEQSRSYEFGFNLEGYQHRHESKDKKGIIMGEFGFITADGVYHVTAYATDENGKFKILFMKNIKIGLPGNQSASALQLPRKPPAISISTTAPPKQSIRQLSLRQFETNTRSCSGCAIPDSIERKPSAPNKISKESESVKFASNNRKSAADHNKSHNYTNRKSTDNLMIQPAPTSSSSGRSKTYSNKQLKAQEEPKLNYNPGMVNNEISFEKRQKQSDEKANGDHTSGISNSQSDFRGNHNPSRFISSTNDRQTKRKSPKARKLGDINGRRTLKAGIDLAALEEMRKSLDGLLYKFNYTVGYHGHHEKGDFQGSKDGGYDFVGRDGLRRNVEYIANDFGYQPYLSQEQENDSKVPKEETEKQAGIQGFEFKWFSERE